MRNIVRTIMLIMLSAVAFVAAGQGYEIDRVCVGAERHYRIDGEAGSIYTWQLTDAGGMVTNLPETADTVTITWNVPTGTYTLSTIQTGINGCDSLQLGTIEVFDLPDAFAGNSLTLCAPAPVILSSAIAANYSTLQWSSGGDGTFDDEFALNPTYTLGANDITLGSVTLTLTASGLGNNGSCPPATSSLTITISSLMADITITPASCNGTSDGAVTMVASGGTEPYIYNLDGNTNATGEFTGLAGGTYTYIISDASGCEITGEVIVTSPDLIAAIVTQTNINCYGAANGAIEITEITGGSGSYEFRINGGPWQSATVFTGLTPGNYLVEVQDTNAPGCIVDLGTITITEPDILAASTTWTDETYPGANDGTITVSLPAGGSGAYEYSIDGINWQASGNFTSLAPGSYEVFIRDANAITCFISLTTIEILPGGALTATVSQTNVTCFGGNDGTITITDPQNGSGNYEYSIDGGATWQNSGTYTGLIAGNYVVMMRDADATANMVTLTTVIITEPAILAATVTFTNETFTGANDGTITVSLPTGGSGAYEFSIDGVNWQASGNFVSLAPGSYEVFIRDANAITCFISLTTIEILPGGALTATVSQTNVTCFGGNDGTITITDPQNGSGNYEFSIDGGATWQNSGTYTGLIAGNYVVMMRDADATANMVTLTTVIITEPAILAATVTFTNETFTGANDGTITVSLPTGGSGAYEYSIDGINWQASGNFTSLAPGSYEVFIRDANAINCFISLTTIEILPGGALTATVSQTNVTCFGGNDGTITITDPQNGSGNYEFSIDGGATWQNSGTYTGLIAGNYVVMMRDADATANMVTLTTVIITEPAILAATVTFTNETFTGANDGTITVSLPTGGSGAYEYSIDGINWQASGNFTSLAPGSYEVFIRDANAINCFISLTTIEILPGGALTATVSQTNVTCFGGNDGTITITDPQNGSGNYEYSIDGGGTWQNSSAYTGLIAGSYVVMMRDADATANMVTLTTVIITEPAILAATVTFTNETFTGADDGTITVSLPTGGSGAYEYSIDGINWQASGNFTSLAPGSYEVFIRDANATICFISLTTIEILPGGALTATVSQTNVTCFGGNDGTITITDPQNGSGNYEYSIDGGATWQNSGDYTGLIAGNYVVMMRDADEPVNVVTLSTIVITEPAILAATVTFTNETFTGANDGTITVSLPTGGSGAYEFSIDGINWQASGNFVNLAPGSYEVFIRDANAITCFISLTTIEILPGGALTATVSQTNVTCFGGNDGTINITDPQNGSGNYEYSIDGGATWQNSGTYTGLIAGNYVVMMRDADATANMVTLTTVIITEPAILAATVTFTNETFTGANDGTITVSLPTGGSGAYEFSIDGVNWQASGNFVSLAPGSYEVFIRDANAITCFISLTTIEILPGGALTATVSQTNVTCFGGNDGTITITDPQNGSGNYEYSIDGGATWQNSGTYTGLIAGNYVVMMRDADEPVNVVTLSTIIITEPAILAATVSFTNETIPGANDGTITISAPSGGSGVYEYSINGFIWQTSGIFTNLVPGVYQVYMRDANATACYINLITLEILEAGTLTAEITSTNASCFGGNDGTITFSNPTGGSGNYEYSIDAGATWQPNGNYTGLYSGSYVAMLRDAGEPANTVTLSTIVITEPEILSAMVSFTNETIPGANDGTITVSAPSGGSGIYEYSIDGTNWQASGTFTGLTPGSYEVFIRDANAIGCFINLMTIEILPGSSLTASIDYTDVTCFGGNDGTITITNPTGGSGNYEYSIDGGATWQNSGVYTGLIAGSYAVMLRDTDVPANMVALSTIIITEPAILAASVNFTNETFAGANDGTITMSAPSGGSGNYEFSIDGTNWQASGSFTALAPGNYEVFIRDANATGCFISLIFVNILPGGTLYAEVNYTNITCYGSNDGTTTIINPTGGSGNYEYSIDGGTTWQNSGTYTGLPAGTYIVRLRDANEPGNMVTLGNIVITEPVVLSATVTSTPAGCAGVADGEIVFSGATGGSGDHEFSIDGGLTWQPGEEFLNLVAGTYTAWMRDANHTDCSLFIGDVNVTEPPAIVAVAESTGTTCNQENGTITITASGGTGELGYMLEGITGWQAENQFTGLISGTYSVRIHDAEGCEITLNGIVVESITGPSITNIEVTNASNSLANGSATIVADSPALPLQYSLTNNGSDWQASPVFDNLAIGPYIAYVMDANGCVVSMEFTILNTVDGQVEISADTVTYCLNLPVIIPVEAKDFTDISSFIIELEFDPAIISFNGLTDINTELENGTFSTSIIGNVLQIRYSIWEGSATVGPTQQLFSLSFNGLAPGNSNLMWNWLQCVIYSATNDSVPGIYVNGLAEILPSPVIYTEGSGVYCEGDTLTLHAGSLDDQYINFEWTGPTGFKHNQPDWQLGQLGMIDNGDFRLLATNPDLCNSTQVVSVKVNPKPVINISYADTICFGQQVLLDPGSGFVSYLWQDGSTEQNQLAWEEGVYWVQVADINSCRAVDTVQLVPCNIELLIPNAFTPNGDGLNDAFRPIFRGFETFMFNMSIYTKWGQLIFTTTDAITGWDGTIDGVPAAPGVYVFVISYEAPSYVTRTLPSPVTGDVSLIR
ncbi:MAG: gliding motility-associated C-terminal domain-containing protein [Lentimicrobium sp.]